MNVPIALYPIADVDNSGAVDSGDVAALENIIAAIADTSGSTKATLWHYNYHDTNGDGIMDEELVSTKFPIVSAIMTGSANSFIFTLSMGIVDEIKGASYGSSNDKFLYAETYLNTARVAKLGSSSTSITFEDGKAGSSDIIREKNVTCVLSDWNRTYLENESSFEGAGIDVVRIAAASFEPAVYTHSISLMGLLFSKQSSAETMLNYYNEAYTDIKEAVSTLSESQIKKAVASSMTGYMSSEGSDYTAFCEAAGAKFGLSGFNFGGSTSAKVSDNLSVFDNTKYSYDNIVHIRTALTYGSTTSEVAKYWSEYANAMNLWEHAYDGQILVSGAIPVPARIAYIAYGIYGDSVDGLNKGWADGIHSNFVDLFSEYAGVDMTEANKTLVLTSYEYSVTVEDGVTVKKTDGTAISSGDKFPYGTRLCLTADTVKEGYTLRADGSTLNEDGSFIVCDNIRARYVDNDVINGLTAIAERFTNAYGEGVYGTASCTADNEGTFTISGTSYKNAPSSKTPSFTYYDTKDLAKTKFDELKTTLEKKTYNVLDVSAYSDKFDGIYVQYSNNVKDTYIGSTLYICAYKDNTVIDMVGTYVSNYYFDSTFDEHKSDSDKCLKFFGDGATAFVDALSKAYNPTA